MEMLEIAEKVTIIILNLLLIYEAVQRIRKG